MFKQRLIGLCFGYFSFNGGIRIQKFEGCETNKFIMSLTGIDSLKSSPSRKDFTKMHKSKHLSRCRIEIVFATFIFIFGRTKISQK